MMSGEEREKQVKDHLVANQEAIQIPAENDSLVEKFGRNGRHPKREQLPLKLYLNNHIVSLHKERNLVFVDDL